ncbi:MAG: HAMP domain-containing protein [Nitrospirae bacterium]|nr:HAMP domain-containing protein [Nitrospirota bacterium]
MRIWKKLMVGFGVYVTLAAIIGIFAYVELRTITKRFTVVEVADDITNIILEVRRFEKNFLLYKDDDTFQEIKKYLAVLTDDTDKIRKEIIKEVGTDNYEMMKNAIAEYDFQINILSKNFKLQKEFISKIGVLTRSIEKNLSGDVLNSFLIVRKYEKNLMIYRDKDIYATLINTLNSPKFATAEVNRYRSLINGLFKLYREEQSSIEKIRSKARNIQTFTEDLSKRERANITTILSRSAILLLFAVLTIIILGTAVNIKIANSIATPLKQLEGITKKIATADFSKRIDVRGKDELASLGTAFNQMQDQLQNTMRFLELANEKLRESRAQLVETEKLATLGRFSAGVAHEINNPLAIINEKAGLMKDYIDMSEDFPNKEKFNVMLNAIFDSVRRCSSITHRILGFARKTDITPEAINLNSLVNEVLKFLEKEILYKSIRLELELSEALPVIKSDKIQLQQVFLNIIKNAADAVEEGGLIRISTGIKNNTTFQVSVEDNGYGIPKEMLKNIFEPFFTTKEKGKGTGLGLSISYGIIKKLGGNILVKSEQNKGTTFTVEIPV